MKRLFVVLTVLIVALAFASTIKIGAVLPLSDITGRQAANAMKLAVKEINEAGGVLGMPVELFIIDDEMKPEKGAAAIDRLATVEKVDFFVGGMSSGVHLAQIPILKKYQKITVWIGAASYKCEEAIGPDADWHFHLHPWDYLQGESYAHGWRAIIQKYPQVKIEKIFIAYEEGTFGTTSFKSYQEEFELAKKGTGVWAGLMKDLRGAPFKSAALGGGDYRAVLMQAKQLKQKVGTMSGGQQRMVAVARALMSFPKLLILDEPSVGLQPSIVSELFSKLKEINNQGVSILLIEQNVKQGLKVVERGYVIENGRIVLEDSSTNLMNNDHIKKAYLGL